MRRKLFSLFLMLATTVVAMAYELTDAQTTFTEAETTFAMTVTEAPKDGLTMAGAFVLQDDVAMNVEMVYTEFAVDGFCNVPVWYAFTVTKDGDAKINITYDDQYSKPQFTVYKNDVATDLTESKINYYNGTITLEGAHEGDVYHVAFSYNTCTTTITASQPEEKYTISWTVTGQLSRYNEEFYCMDQYYNDYTNGQQLASGTTVILFAACDNERRGYEILVNGVDKTSSMVSGSLEFNISENTEVTVIFKYTSAITEIDSHIATFNSTKLMAEDKLEVNDDSEIWVLDFRGASNDGEIKGLNMENHPNAIIYVDNGMTVDGIENNIAVYDGESTNTMENLVITDGYPFYILNTFNAVNASYSRTVNNTYGTIVLPYDFESDENVQFYTFDRINGNSLFISEVDEVYAGTPVLFKKKTSATTLTIPATDSDYIMDQVNPTSSGLSVNGTFQKLTGQTGMYFIAQDKFYYAEDAITIAPFRAWFNNSGDSAKTLTIVIEGETDAILAIDADGNITEGEVYNLAGQRLAAPKKGQVNIINGKKVMIK